MLENGSRAKKVPPRTHTSYLPLLAKKDHSLRIHQYCHRLSTPYINTQTLLYTVPSANSFRGPNTGGFFQTKN